MIYTNRFQRMLLNDLQANKAIMVEERILHLYFPVDSKSDFWFEVQMTFIAEGMEPTGVGDPWCQKDCEIFCSRNSLMMHNVNGGEVFFILREI